MCNLKLKKTASKQSPNKKVPSYTVRFLLLCVVCYSVRLVFLLCDRAMTSIRWILAVQGIHEAPETISQLVALKKTREKTVQKRPVLCISAHTKIKKNPRNGRGCQVEISRASKHRRECASWEKWPTGNG